jgi:hypothetical protein
LYSISVGASFSNGRTLNASIRGPWPRLPIPLRRGSRALLFLFFHKRLCGPLANNRFHHQPNPQHPPASKLEAAYHRADKAIQQLVDLLAA